ncbi:N2227-like protein-domain-containing protein [Chaetomium strumarium]|uniref:N2227-like protein-domain-containing protein n=1 Tax=Chaetomium strumarium TaxID=1170767 RepID=A0AAJ0GRM3_9PEZI|nr:N2227-like protein-domain-containing protein [Chaetomium strumarium]
MRPITWTVAAICWLCGSIVLCGEDPSGTGGDGASAEGLVGVEALDPQYLVYQIRQMEVLAEDASLLAKPDTERHLKEKEMLRQRLDKKQGVWNEHHPRHRLLEALRGFSAYAETQQTELNRLKGLYRHVSKQQKKVLERDVKYSQKFTTIFHLLEQNQQLCSEVVRNGLDFYEIEQQELDEHIRSMKAAGRAPERVSVSQALKHFIRDWAASGANERDAAFPCILGALKKLFPTSNAADQEVKVLLPGAGVGRLGHEVAQLPGLQVTNNEWSAYQNLAYRFLTAHPHNLPNSSSIHPFIDSWSHHRTTADMFRPISFPDVPLNPQSVLLVEGDFTTAFREDEYTGSYDVVVTHFFIDTARNLMSYLDTITRVVKPGGYWINFGPLLYGSAPFVQLTLEEIVIVAEGMGFEFLDLEATMPLGGDGECRLEEVTLPGKRVYGVEAVYGFDERALTRNAYQAQFWVAKKRG